MRRVLAPGFGFLLASLLAPGIAAASAERHEVLARRLDALRTPSRELGEQERELVREAQTEAIGALLEDPELGAAVIRQVVGRERSDSRFAIGLVGVLLGIEDYSRQALIDGSSLLAWVDPNANSQSFFSTAFEMARSCPAACSAALLKVLELESLAFPVPMHAMTLDVDLGLQFAIGLGGRRLLDGLTAALESDSCTVRANAARSLSFLLPRAPPAALVAMARSEPCSGARLAAVKALGSLDPPELPDLAAELLAAPGGLGREEKLALVEALGLSFNPRVLAQLELLRADGDPRVGEAAARASEHLQDSAPSPARLAALLGSAGEDEHAELLRHLEATAESGRFALALGFEELISRLQPADLELLDAARSAVLRRLSDECLHEYRELTYAARALRSGLHVDPGLEWIP